jgi:WD40 repeat protein
MLLSTINVKSLFLLYLCLNPNLVLDYCAESFVIRPFIITTRLKNIAIKDIKNSARDVTRATSPPLKESFHSEHHADEPNDKSMQYDDFGDFIPGKEPIQFNEMDVVEEYPEETRIMDYRQLSSLVSKSFQEEVTRDTRIAFNWRQGNWKVRGFSLDKYTYHPSSYNQTQTQTNATEGKAFMTNRKKDSIQTQLDPVNQPIYISKVVMERTHVDDINHYKKDIIAVGRTDGSIIIVQLGSEILTKFVGEYNPDMNAATDIERVFQREESMSTTDPRDDSLNRTRPIHRDKPFQVLSSLQAHQINEQITAILLLDDTLYTAAGTSGDVKIWKLEDTKEKVSSEIEIIPIITLSGAHSGKIVSLTTLSSKSDSGGDYDLLLSTCDDGSFALWDLSTSKLLSLQNIRNLQDNESVFINCADAYENIIALGLNNGRNVTYYYDRHYHKSYS